MDASVRSMLSKSQIFASASTNQTIQSIQRYNPPMVRHRHVNGTKHRSRNSGKSRQESTDGRVKFWGRQHAQGMDEGYVSGQWPAYPAWFMTLLTEDYRARTNYGITFDCGLLDFSVDGSTGLTITTTRRNKITPLKRVSSSPYSFILALGSPV